MTIEFQWPDTRFTDLGASVSRETGEKLALYAALLEKWQQKVNLVAPSTLSEIINRHMLDSAQLLAYLPENASRILDMGSGAGFPGMVLAMLTGHDVHLVESDTKKAIFLREVARETQTIVTIHNERVESLDFIGAQVLTARALASLDKLLHLSTVQHHSEMIALFLKGRGVQSEIDELRSWDGLDIRLFPSITEADARIIHITGF